MRRRWLFLGLLGWLSLPGSALGHAESFPLVAGIEENVEFWKRIFTRYGKSEVVFHDREAPLTIYRVVRIPEGPQARRLIQEERERLLAELGLPKDSSAVRAQRGVRERFASGLRRSQAYIGQMRRIFEEEGLPPELAYLPLIESSFDHTARSHAGAVGVWQFIRSTGQRFLTITKSVDERRDPLEATRAAARFLKRNHEVLGNWPLAITAYNHGREGMLRAVREVGSRDLGEIIRNYQGPAFGFASKNFYAEFLAALEIVKNAEEYFPDLQYEEPVEFEEIEVRKPLPVALLLRRSGISREEFFAWNPALNPRISELPRGYRVKIPPPHRPSVQNAFLRLVSSSESASAVQKNETRRREAAPYRYHRVRAGETLSEIARRYGTSVGTIQELNRLRSHRIVAGRQLKIPKL
jgi:membrane-bound lytic murein transglycosylase D